MNKKKEGKKDLIKQMRVESLLKPNLSESFLQINFADLSPNYIGTLCGISNTLANITGFVSPIVTGLLTNGNVRMKVPTKEITYSCVDWSWNPVHFLFSANYLSLEDSISHQCLHLNYNDNYLHVLGKCWRSDLE